MAAFSDDFVFRALFEISGRVVGNPARSAHHNKAHEPSEGKQPSSHPTQDEKAKADHEKVLVEIRKNVEEVRRLRSENSLICRFVRVVMPLITGVATVIISCFALWVSLRSLARSTEAENRKTFSSTLELATDEKAGQDARVAGIWALRPYWRDPKYSDIVANSLAAILATGVGGGDFVAPFKTQRLRQAAADVIGKAAEGEDGQSEEATRIRKLLFGDAPTGALGAVTRYQQSLFALRQSLIDRKENTTSVELSLQATKEAIRQNWKHLQGSMFAGHDLSWIILYKGNAAGAYFGGANLTGANLCGADLSNATFKNADLSNADLEDANLSSTYGWGSANLTGTNIHNASAPKDFFERAKAQNTVNITSEKWGDELKKRGVMVPDYARYTDCGKPGMP